jgi:hypothetical protein
MKGLAFFAPLALLTPLAADALLTTPSTEACGTATCLLMTGNQTSQAEIDTVIAGVLGGSRELYTHQVGGSEAGAFAGAYLTESQNTSSDSQDATITYVGGDVLGGATHLLVKVGHHSPAWYLYELSWNGTETITLDHFWPNQGAISHVSIYGIAGSATRLPQPGTMGLLGAGLLAFEFLRRRKAA